MSAQPDSQVFYIDSAMQLPDDEYLQGYVELDDALVIGKAGLAKFRKQQGRIPYGKPLDGAFIGFFQEDSNCFLTTDITGQELLYFYLSGNKWAFSNSLYYLHQAIKKHGWPLTPHHQAIQLLGVQAWNAQPYTDQTVFEEVRLLASTEFVKFSRVLLKNEGTSLPEVQDHTWRRVLKPEEPVGLKTLIDDALTSSFRTIQAFANIGSDFEVICQISGGYDSRTCLALLSQCFEHTSQIHAQSNRSSPSELAVAEQVTAKASIPLNDFKRRNSDISTEHAYQIWKLSSLGSYVPIYTSPFSSPSFAVQVKGDLCISLSESIYGRHSRALRNRARSKIANSSVTNFLNTELDNFRKKVLKQGLTERAVTMLLYTEFRSRFHCGRRWVRRLSLYGMVCSPLATSKVMRASILAAEQGFSLKQFKMQLLLAADEAIATQPYSEKHKDFSEEDLEYRLYGRSLTFTQPARQVFIDKEDYTSAYAPHVKDKFSESEFLKLLKTDFECYRDQLKNAGYVSDDLIKRAEEELTKEGLSLSHNYRHASLCVNMGFAYFG